MYRNNNCGCRLNNCFRPSNNCCRPMCDFRNDFMRGPRGPIGPAGPQGVPGGSVLADFINGNTGEVAVGEVLPFTNNINLSSGNIVSTNGTNTITLVNPGTYRVTYNTNATSTTAGLVGVTVTLYRLR